MTLLIRDQLTCPPTWFAGFQVWWPDLRGVDFFAEETAHNGDSRIGEGDSEDESLASLMTCWDARSRNLQLWHAEDSQNADASHAHRIATGVRALNPTTKSKGQP